MVDDGGAGSAGDDPPAAGGEPSGAGGVVEGAGDPDDAVGGDRGEDLAAVAVEAMRSSAAIQAAAEAMQLQALATLAQVRRTQARARAERRAERLRRERPGTPRRPVRVDLELVDRCTAQEVSVALWLSPVVARDRLHLALELVEERPATFDALRAGTIDLVRARRIVDAVRPLTCEVLPGTEGGPGVPDGRAAAGAAGADADADADVDAGGEAGADSAGSEAAGDVDEVAEVRPPGDAASAVEAEALYPGSVPVLADLRPGRAAAELTPSQLTARLSRLVLRAAPRSALRRTAEADARRGCTLRVLPDGMALLSVTGRMELLGAVFAKVDGTARALLAADAAAASRAVRAASGAAVGAGAGAGAATGLAAPSPVASGPVASGVAASGPAVADGLGAARAMDSAIDAFAPAVADVAVDAEHDEAGASTADTPDARRAGAPGPDPARTLDQTRVDVFLAAVLGDSRDLGRARGVQVTVAMVAPADTVLAGGDEPGELLGLGPVAAPLVRELAADAAWVRWASEPITGQVTAVGRRTYRPSAAVADLVRARDQRCRFPTCRRSARSCDLDHVVPFPEGATEPDNLGATCRTHHLTKHRSGFRVRLDPDGTYVWTTPTGQTVLDTPPSWGAGTTGGGTDPETTTDHPRPG